MKTLLAALCLISFAVRANVPTVLENGVTRSMTAAEVETWLANNAKPAPVLHHNPAWDRYWWLYGICQRYGLTLPCDIAELRVAMYAATTPENAAGVALDAVDAVTCFFANGGTAADWSTPPPEMIP